MSWKVEVLADNSGKFVSNSMRFSTKEGAEFYANDLFARWTAVRQIRVVESSNPANFKVVDEKIVRMDHAASQGEASNG